MPTPFRTRAAAGLFAAIAASGANAAPATFDFTVAGLPIGTIATNSSQEGSRYGAIANIDATGLLGFFTSFYFHGRSSGTVRGDGTVLPARFEAESKSARAVRRTTIDWKDGRPVSVSIEPPRSDNADPAEQGGTLDPVSAAFRLLRDMPEGDVCNVTVDMFDGSRRSRLSVGEPRANGSTLTCDGTYARMKGESLGSLDRNQFPFTLTYAVGADGIARVQRIEAPTNFGKALVARKG